MIIYCILDNLPSTKIIGIHITKNYAAISSIIALGQLSRKKKIFIPMKLKHIQGSHIHSLPRNINTLPDIATCHLNRWRHPFSKTASHNRRGKHAVRVPFLYCPTKRFQFLSIQPKRCKLDQYNKQEALTLLSSPRIQVGALDELY